MMMASLNPNSISIPISSSNSNSTQLFFSTPPLPLPWLKKMKSITSTTTMARRRSSSNSSFKVNAFFLNPSDQRILKEALEEPVAFMGGMFAGLLRLDLSEDPLKEWVARTVEASGITEAEIDAPDSETEESPQEIEIE